MRTRERFVTQEERRKILGHKDTEMISRHYNKLRARREHLRDQLGKARGRQAADGAVG